MNEASRAQATVRAVIVDDEALMRAGLRLMLDGANGIDIVGEAADGHEALTLIQAASPDVILLDIRMPRMNGLETVEALGAHAITTPVVMLTAFDTDEFLLTALRNGATSFLLKDSPPDQVVAAVLEAARGTARFSPVVLERLVRLASKPASAADGHVQHAVEVRPPAGVTEREWEVAALVAQGLTNAEIGAELFLSLPTVKTHLGRLFDKLQVTNRVQLAIAVLERTP